jgi:hypothetical protein
MAKPNLKRRTGADYDRRIHPTAPAIVVDDPIEFGAKLLVTRITRDDPLAKLHARRQIDDAQYYAGRAYQKDWETAERGPRAIDPTKEAVDGGRMPEPITDAQKQAAGRLNAVIKQIGADGVCIIHDFLIDRMTIAGLAERRGYKGRSWEE